MRATQQAVLLLVLSCSAIAQSKAAAKVTVDFGNRLDRRYPIPAQMLGAQLGWIPNGFYKDKQALAALRRAGFSSLRLDALLQKVYATEKPDWSETDAVIRAVLQAGFEPLIVVGYTPAWLQPKGRTCPPDAAPYHAPPVSVERWAGLAAALVAHMDAAFSGQVHEYEIWNEPDSKAGLCAGGPARRRAAYGQMYVAATPAMRAQARQDGAAIRVGGPALARPESAEQWLPGLMTQNDTRPDFISYHDYVGDGAGKLTWDGGDGSLPARTQDPRHGIAAGYMHVRRAAGPAAKSPAVYLDEYNTSSRYKPDCCRNDPVFAPVWNALVIQELLNASYKGAKVPERVMYFAAQDWFANASPGTAWFCLMGAVNTRMDCDYSGGRADPYPQYYAYALMASGEYLQLSGGGYMAPAVRVEAGRVIKVAAWYSDTAEMVLITNSGTDEAMLQLQLQRAGNIRVPATRFVLDREHPQIAADTVGLIAGQQNYSAQVRVPRDSVVGVRVHADANTR